MWSVSFMLLDFDDYLWFSSTLIHLRYFNSGLHCNGFLTNKSLCDQNIQFSLFFCFDFISELSKVSSLYFSGYNNYLSLMSLFDLPCFYFSDTVISILFLPVTLLFNKDLYKTEILLSFPLSSYIYSIHHRTSEKSHSQVDLFSLFVFLVFN